MKKIVGIVAALAIVMLMGATAYAADATDAVGATVTGEPICTMSISSTDLSIDAPTDAGEHDVEFTTGSPITMEITDNIVAPVQDAAIISAQAISSEPSQYWDTQGDTYLIYLDNGIWTPAADNDATPLVSQDEQIFFSGSEDYIFFGSSPSGEILHGTLEFPLYLYVQEGKRLYGDTADSITIQFTFVDN